MSEFASSSSSRPTRHRLLLVEDNPGDVDLVREYLLDVPDDISLEVRETLGEALEVLDRNDLTALLLDLNLPDSTGLETLDRVLESGAGLPVIVLTGADGDHIGLEAVARGAADFLPKGELSGPVLSRSVRYAVERSIRQERLQFHADVLEAVGQGVVVTDVEGRITYCNGAAEELFGWGEQEVLGRSVTEVVPLEISPEVDAAILDTLRSGRTWTGEFEVEPRNGPTLQLLVTFSPILDQKDRLVGIIRNSSDITEQRELEARLNQAQRMEAIGRLAGGIAHDFNNLLTAIEGHASMLLAELNEGSALREDVEEIRRAGQRAADLTRQLLAFSRNQLLQERKVDLVRAARELKSMLRRLIPARIDLDIMAEGELVVRADPGQLQQIVMNLVVNAADSIEDGGRITIRLDAVELSASDIEEISGDVAPGPYARLAVQDSGTGMSAEVLDHIFEPFFTTKPEGQGTGLGLATVLGVVQQSGGHVRVDSTPGRGTTFQVLLPRLAEAPDRIPERGDGTVDRAGPAAVLIVEDDPAVRGIARRILERSGYAVLEAETGKIALEVARGNEGLIDLVITDVVMPDLGGVDLQKRLKRDYPDLPVVLMSGYSEAEVRAEIQQVGAAFLAKPFMPDSLLQCVATALSDRASGEGGKPRSA